jgi:hypothetical protein
MLQNIISTFPEELRHSLNKLKSPHPAKLKIQRVFHTTGFSLWVLTLQTLLFFQ